MNLEKTLGLSSDGKNATLDQEKILQYINLKLAALNAPIYNKHKDSEFLNIANPLLRNHQEKNRLLSNQLCPADTRVQNFLNRYLEDVCPNGIAKLPHTTFILDRHGLARTLSVPPDVDKFESDIIKSYRIKQGILNNPKHDRRTTKGVFHIAEGGFPIPDDKKAVPKITFAKLYEASLNPPKEVMRLPFTASQEEQAEVFVSLLMRPLVCPHVPGFTNEKSTEVRFLAPGNLVSNLDFVESIFGNGGDPYLPENDSGLDIDHWTGHTGYVILAPHLIYLKKKDLGLPFEEQATERQKRDGMCWKDDNELYNGGTPFKITARDEQGVMVTIIADNYYGYCKKEVKTQIGFSSNLFGMSEEEHAGGAIAFPSYDLGEEFHLDRSLPQNNMTFDQMYDMYKEMMDLQPEGHAIDKTYSNIIYVPENSKFNLPKQSITWEKDGQEQKIKLLANHFYILPSGYKIQIQKQIGSLQWHLIGMAGEGTLCHKPCTVSGGGKSEISKSISDAMVQGSIFTANIKKDFDYIEEILKYDFSKRFKESYESPRPSRPVLSPERSLGSVIKLFTPSSEYTDEYNEWLNSIIPPIKDIIYVIKRHYRSEWGENWRDHFSVDMINGYTGHELKYADKKIVSNYLRVGYEKNGRRRVYKTRQDYYPAQKLQVEDDITCSTVAPTSALKGLNPEYKNPSIKIVKNCENRLFQRPDDCIHPGYDKQAEADLSSPNTFLSNYEPLHREEAKEIIDDAIGFERYTNNVKDLLKGFVDQEKPEYVASTSHPRIWEGKPTKNPRYLQNRPDLVNPQSKYLAEIGTRLFRKIPLNDAVYLPVNAVLPGRRNNPPDKKNGILPLAVYNPVHYQELPELFMDFVCSVTGKSPSTTGFGSEGALTKGPFNALWFAADLNNALVSYILTGYDGFSSAAGYVGPEYRMDHDISLLIPEIWCRMTPEERNPQFLIENGYLERVEDFEHQGEKIPASILGYRITLKFIHAFCGRIFNNPDAVFSEEMLKPELQNLDTFIEGVQNIATTQKQVAQHYLNDGTIDACCPPLKALIHIMADGEFEGKDLNHPDIRKMFTREYLLESDWYQQRLQTKQIRDTELWKKHIQYLKQFIATGADSEAVAELKIEDRLGQALEELEKVQSKDYLKKLHGTIGADTFELQFKDQRSKIKAKI